MGCSHDVMPTKLSFSLFHGDVEAYKEALYKIFKRDFVDNELLFQNKPVDIIHEKLFENKERSFWHIISEGEEDTNRTPITWRAEALPFAKPLIQDKEACTEYTSWKKYHDKSKKDRYYIWCTEVNYLVILEDRGNHFKLISAYPVIEQRRKAYMKDYQNNKI